VDMVIISTACAKREAVRDSRALETFPVVLRPGPFIYVKFGPARAPD
jgi:hypothetical protein